MTVTHTEEGPMAERTEEEYDCHRCGGIVRWFHGSMGHTAEACIFSLAARIAALESREPPADPHRPAAILAREFPLPEAP